MNQNFNTGRQTMMFKLKLLSATTTSLMLAPMGAFAQEDISREATELDKIVVEGRRTHRSRPDLPTVTPVQVLAGSELAHRRQGGLGETLAGLPGVHLDNFGGGASRPVIRGQTVPRIEILSDGANLFDASSVSPDHAITTDPLLLDGIEILRGPAATRYGGNAVNGAINLIDSKIPKAAPENGLSGAAEIRYGTGDEEKTAAGRITAGIGPLVIHAEGSKHSSDDYAVPESFGSDKLRDAFSSGSSLSFGASWVTPKGYIGAAYTRQDSEYGLPGHSHINGVCHTHGIDLHCESHGEYDDPFGSSDSHTAYIKLRSERVDVRGDYDDPMPGFSHARLRLSHTDYEHDEIDGPALFAHYANEVQDGRIELTHKPLLGFTGTFGVEYTDGTFLGLNNNRVHQDSKSRPYLTRNLGVFLSEQRSFGAFDIELAARKDWREIKVPMPTYPEPTPELVAIYEQAWGPNWRDRLYQRRYNSHVTAYPTSEEAPFSASIAGTWNMGAGYSATLSLGRTERLPDIRELYAYGNNLATNSYEVGLSQTGRASSQFPASRVDVIETNRSVDLTLRKTGGPLEFEIGLFHQDVDDYIFARLIETDDATGVPHNYLIYTAANATFQGIDGQVSYRFTAESRLTVFGDYVHAELKSEDDNLPRIPPGRLGARHEHHWGPLSADLEYYRTFSQDHFASYETRTGGYDMLNATLAYRLQRGDAAPIEFYLRGTNLTNELAFSHTSFVKDQSPLRGRNLVFGIRYAF